MKRSKISVLSRGGAGRCIACGRREATNALSEVKLFQFPAAGERRRELWLNRCGLRAETLPSRVRICNIHFVSGEPANSEQHVDYAPSRHLVGFSTDGLPARTTQGLRSNEPALSPLGDLSPPLTSRVSKRGPPKTVTSGRSSKAKRKSSSGRGGTSTTSSSIAAVDAVGDGANTAMSKSPDCADDWDDSENAEDESLLFDDECPRVECQHQARHLVELLARVGTLERTIGDLRHDLDDKEREIAALLVQIKKSPWVRMQLKSECQQKTIAKLRADLNALRRQEKPKKRSANTRSRDGAGVRCIDDEFSKTILATSGPTRKRLTTSIRRPKKRGRFEEFNEATPDPPQVPRSPLKLRIRTDTLRYFEDDASSSSIEALAGEGDSIDADLVSANDDNGVRDSGDGRSEHGGEAAALRIKSSPQTEPEYNTVSRDEDIVSIVLRETVRRVLNKSAHSDVDPVSADQHNLETTL